MDAETVPKPARPRLNPYTKALRRERIFSRLRMGWPTAEIAREERLSERRVRKIVSDALRRRTVDDASDHALLQLVRLEGAQALAAEAIDAGELKAIAPTSRCSMGSTATTRRARRGPSMTTPRGRGSSPR